MPKTTNRREFLQLAKSYDPKKPPRGGYNFANWLLSEKLDGSRCFWDGGLTRGMRTVDVPWAGLINPKTGKMKTKIKTTATGLWSRYGNPIMAPDWFLNMLPCMPLDGELFLGRGQFQKSRSTVSKDIPVDSEWEDIQYAVYSSPPFEAVFGDGEIKNANMVASIQWSTIRQFISRRASVLEGDFIRALGGFSFDQELGLLNDALDNCITYLHQQVRLPDNHEDAVYEIERQMDETLDLGGEGLIIRSSEALWYPKRMAHMLKVKPAFDDEAVITGFTSGNVGKQGTLLGKIGAIITEYHGKRFELSGMTHEEREFATKDMEAFATQHPGVDMPAHFRGKHFGVGDTITFKYRELSDDGIPKDGRYFRQA
jgi:DNA ligase-1